VNDSIEHEQAFELLPWLVNGRLEPPERDAVEAHLRSCLPCRRELKEQQRLRTALREHPAVHISPQTSFERLARRLAEPAVTPPRPARTRVRFFAVDGSTFLDGDYLIKGVAGRVLWVLLGHHAREGRTDFTNKEVRLDPSLELPEFRDNLESRLILLKRRLDERDAPIRIEKTGRGRFRLLVDGELLLEQVT
jgi:hypothetical protein